MQPCGAATGPRAWCKEGFKLGPIRTGAGRLVRGLQAHRHKGLCTTFALPPACSLQAMGVVVVMVVVGRGPRTVLELPCYYPAISCSMF
jgi:hypothetical protein